MARDRFRNAVAVCMLAATLVAWGCAATTPNAADAPSVAEDRAAIGAQSRRLSDAYVRGDYEALVSIYAPDGVAIAGKRDAVRSRDALLRLWTLPPGRRVLRHAAVPVELTVDGDHAYEWGYYEGQTAQDGVPGQPFRGAYVIVWERGADGMWRMAVDMWNSL